MKPRDSNHWWRYTIVKFKRTYRQNAKKDVLSLWLAMVDSINALVRVVLGLIVVFSSLAADLCKKEQQRWYRKL